MPFQKLTNNEQICASIRHRLLLSFSTVEKWDRYEPLPLEKFHLIRTPAPQLLIKKKHVLENWVISAKISPKRQKNVHYHWKHMSMALSLLVATRAQCGSRKAGERGGVYDGPLLRIMLFFRCHLFPACVTCLANNGKTPHYSDYCNECYKNFHP